MKKFFVVALATCALIAVAHSPLSAQKKKMEQHYYLDVHKLTPGGVTYADVAGAHQKDLATEGKRDVSFIKYWVDEKQGLVYCLSSANSADDVYNTHKDAHGLVPAEIFEVVEGQASNYTGNGKLYLDIHDLGAGNVTAEAVVDAHKKDLATQGQYHVNFINYWVDEKNGKVFCLSEAPDAEAVRNTHKQAHGLLPAEILTVEQGQ